MLADVDDVIRRAGVLLDDPSNSRFTSAYLMPLVDQCYDELDVDLERCGMQYVQSNATVDIAANISDLSYLLADGQALSTMKFPKWVDWKLQGQPDYMYVPSAHVSKLAYVDNAVSYGALQWTFVDGALQVTSSVTPLTLNIFFDEMSMNVYDPAQNVIRGTAHILAAAVAAEAAGIRKGMENVAKRLDAKHMKLWNAFKSVLVMNNQDKQVTAPPMHPRRVVPTPYVAAPTS